MLNFPTKTLELIKKYLLRQRKEVDKNLKEVKKDDPAMNQVVIETSEPGTDSYIADTHTKNIALEDQLKKANTNIKAALLKIRKGTFGKCEKCGKQIGIARLLAMPIASLCLTCSKKGIK